MAFPPHFDASSNATSEVLACDSVLGVALQSVSATGLVLFVAGMAALFYYLAETTFRYHPPPTTRLPLIHQDRPSFLLLSYSHSLVRSALRALKPLPRLVLPARSFKETDWFDNYDFFNAVHRTHADKLKASEHSRPDPPTDVHMPHLRMRHG